MYILCVILGFMIAQLFHIWMRDRESNESPEKFNLVFFVKDTWQKMVLSILSSFTLASLFYILIVIDPNALYDMEWNGVIYSVKINLFIYAFIGAGVDAIFSYAKNKWGFLQPTFVRVKPKDSYQKKTYIRK